MNEIQDHVVYCPEGFYDMQRYPERIEHGKTLTVSRSVFRQMKHSDPSVELRRIEPPKDILQRIVESAREEKAARDEQVADLLDDELVPADHVLDAPVSTPTDEPRSWEPAPHYVGMLNKNDGMEGVNV